MRIRKLMIASCVLVAVGLIVTYRARAGVQQAADVQPATVETLAVQAATPAIPRAAAPVRNEKASVDIGIDRVPLTPLSRSTFLGVPLKTSEDDGEKLGLQALTPIQGLASAVPEDEHLESWVSQALSNYAQTEDQDARAKQRDEIAKGLDQIFDIRQEQRVNELKALEARVQKLRATLDQRATSKNEILKNRLDYLLREADGLGWGDGIPAPRRVGLTGAASAETFDTNPLGQTLLPPGTSNDLNDPLERLDLSRATSFEFIVRPPATSAEFIGRPPANPDSGPARE